MSKKPDGFFKDFHETIAKAIDDVVFNNFANLESDAKRVWYVCGLEAIKSYDLTKHLDKSKEGASFPVYKDVEKARQLKTDGNMAVQKGDWLKALRMYTDSLINMPGSEAEEKAIVLANRSACLYHLQQMDASLADIRRCLELGYPKHLRYKVMERRARCLLALKRHDEAIIAFRETISALDDGKLSSDKKQKMQTDCQLMTEIMKKGKELAKAAPAPPPPSTAGGGGTPAPPKLSGKPNKQYPAASDAIEFTFEESRGRFARATREVSAGEVLLTERAFSGVLLAEYRTTHCHHCFTKCVFPLPCPTCPNVLFCSDACLAAAAGYHAYECAVLPLLWRSGCSVTCMLALRVLTQSSLRRFREIAPTLAAAPAGVYRSDDYRNIYNLVAHEGERGKKDFLHRTEMAVFLLKLLELSGYLEGAPRGGAASVEELRSMSPRSAAREDVELVGGLLLRNLQVLQFNAHEVFELVCAPPAPAARLLPHDGRSVFVAGGVFATLALFNHSCDPAVVRYFNGQNIVVRAVRNVRAGEEISENYGPIFTTVAREARRAALLEQYWFHCDCTACAEDWPLYSDMTETYMRFKCDSDRPCSNVVPVARDTCDFMVQCPLCHQYTNILKGLKSLQDTDMMVRLASGALANGEYAEALRRLAEVLRLYDSTLARPYASYYDVVQNLRRCMLAMGNYSIKV